MAPFDFGKYVLNVADVTTSATLEGVRILLSSSLSWSANQLNTISDVSLIKKVKWADSLQKSSKTLKDANSGSQEALLKALNATSDAFEVSRDFLNLKGEDTRKALFENVYLSSIVGESFAGLIKTSDIKASLRRKASGNEKHGADISPTDAFLEFKRSGLRHALFCMPGMFCDEGLWAEPTNVSNHSENMNTKDYNGSIEKLLEKEKVYPLYFRFNSGVHISQNGSCCLNIFKEFFEQKDAEGMDDIRIDVISYSQGGLILRSALHQAKKENYDLAGRIAKVIMVSSPDGGSYLEKMGFWLGMGLENAPLHIVKAIGFIGNQRSDAIKDLSHGIIREEDWLDKTDDLNEQKDRYNRELYFGELDGVDVTQVYSLISNKKNSVRSWLGDGIVEEPSLTYLSDRVYRKKKNPQKRVFCLTGMNHFQVIFSSELIKILGFVLNERQIDDSEIP